ncbi:Clavaminate synthase-like protein [Sistotremastrum suecicum HHB10207 ss-3]|uniref:Clavaminate synthase-like protein n=1 Tax=Sistotremastrum suecicum HHB10207 ss-3 TaxID=1314776 RepID=A0A166HTH6_9AGAM|nr:Clavaminate synthase-like protein [Sistotremastrum suecicum HHB10207 ss-3]
MFRIALLRPAFAQAGHASKLFNQTKTFASLAEEVRSDSTFHIPVVDFSKFRRARDKAEKKRSADEVVTAFKEVGFVYLKDHGISDEVVQNTFIKSADFFRLPSEAKAKLAWEDPRSNRGYVQQGRERVTQSSDPAEIAALRAKAPDSKESMEIGRDWDATWKNQWPQEKDVPGFKSTMLSFFQTCHELHVSVMSSVALGLGLHEEFFADKIQEQYHNLRLLSYPSIPVSALKEEGTARAGIHSDYGSLTFVFQDDVGGLEVQNPHSGKFHPATPIPGTIVVNVGDLLARWSNDVLRSTRHRVVGPSREKYGSLEMAPARQSIAFFCNPNGTAHISALPTCVSEKAPAKYDPVNTEQYIVRRLSDTYS